MPGVILDRISVTIDKKKILDDISLDVKEGTFVCLLGPTGSGKTTLLKLIAGFVHPSAGAVYYGSGNMTSVAPNKRNVSMVFEDFALYPHMTVFKNIASPLLAKKLQRQEIESKVTEVAKFLKIDGLLDRRINQLSGGQMQRVAIGRALSKEAKIILFDEIFVNLDYKLREQMRIEFKALIDKVKLTTIFSSSDPEDAFSLADKVAVIHGGKILQYDVKEVVYDTPVDVFTGRYFGYPEMNIIECNMIENNGSFVLDAGFFKAPIKNKELNEKIKRGGYLMGLRPEHIKIKEGRQEGEVECEGTLMLTEVIGSDTVVHIEMGKNTIEVFTPGIYRQPIGKKMCITFDPRKLYLFESEEKSGRLLGRGV
jgi:ABC-type sugar transport system ATPase subunit